MKTSENLSNVKSGEDVKPSPAKPKYEIYPSYDYDENYTVEDSYMDAFDGEPDAYWNID